MNDRKRHALVFGIAVFVLAGTLFGMLVAGSRAKNSAAERAEGVLLDSAREQAATFASALSGRFQVLESISISLSCSAQTDPASVERLLNAIAGADGLDFASVSLLYPDGAKATDDDFFDLNFSDRAYFQKAMSGERALERIVGKLTGKTCVALAVPYRQGDKICGVVRGLCYEESLRPILTSQVYSGNGYSFLIRSQGDIIVNAETEKNRFDGDNMYALLEGATFQRKDSLQALHTALGSAQSVTLHYRSASGKAQVAVVVPLQNPNLPENDWFVYNTVSEDSLASEITANRHNSLISMSVFAGFFIIALVLLGLLEQDYRNQQRQETELSRQREEQFRIVTEQSGKSVMRYDILKKAAYLNDPLPDGFGMSRTYQNAVETIIESGYVDPSSIDDFRDFFLQIHRGISPVIADIHMIRADGEHRWFKYISTTIFDRAGLPRTAIISYFDNTEQRERALAYAKWQQELESLSSEHAAMYEWNLTKDAFEQQRGQLVNEYGREGDSFNGRTNAFANAHVLEEDRPAFIAMMNREHLLALYYSKTYRASLDYRCLDGSDGFRWRQISVQLIPHPDNQDIKAFVINRDIDAEKREELALVARSERDFLTGTLNRETFIRRIDELIEAFPSSQHALFMLDIDGFKQVNDQLGHDVGDKVLRDFTDDTRATLRANDVVGRVGGDEFMIFLPNMPLDVAIGKKAMRLCAALRRQLSNQLRISVSIGIAVYPGNGMDFDTLYRCADAALYYAKDSGKDGYAFYREGMATYASASSDVPGALEPVQHPVVHAAADDADACTPELLLSVTDVNEQIEAERILRLRAERDALTGLYNRETFFEKAAERIASHEPGFYVMACMDIDNFKVINDQYGTAKGDEILCNIANAFRDGFDDSSICCRIMADHFAALYPCSLMYSDQLQSIREAAQASDSAMQPVVLSTGRYLVSDPSLEISAMYDRAALAKASVKGRFDIHIALYDESMRERVLHDQQINSEMDAALAAGQFEIWLQPQYNHASGALIGSEALVRWRHPVKGLLLPGEFIPVFERNGFIYELDKFVWEQACKLLATWAESNAVLLPVSVNVSRYDIFRDDFFEVVTGLVKTYRIPLELLRLEITESAFSTSSQQIIAMVKRLTDYGFIVEIDDFGSGYSSLNTLKDVPAQALKLDMRFLENTENSRRGGNILESIVRMAKWLGMSMIAEGVETRAQADYLKSIGCNYMQGYLYAKPMPIAEYTLLAANCGKERYLDVLKTVDALDNNAFWDPHSMETLIFNSYVGGACIFELHNGNLELLRVNEKYVQTLGGDSMSTKSALAVDLAEYMDAHNMALLHQNIQNAVDTGMESACEVQLHGLSDRRPDTYIRTAVRVIAQSGDRKLLYCSIIDMTAQRAAEQKAAQSSEQLQAILDNVNGGVTAVILHNDVPQYLFANDQYFEQLGYTREQFHAEVTSAFDLVHPDDRAHVIEQTRLASVTRAPFTCIYRAIRRDGSLVLLQSNISITSFPGVVEPVQLAVANDVTMQREAEQQRLANAGAHTQDEP